MATTDWPTQRRRLLYGVGCLRRHWAGLSPAARAAVEVVERYADLDATRGDLWEARRRLLGTDRLEDSARELTYTSWATWSDDRVTRMLIELAGEQGGFPAAFAETSSQEAVLADVTRSSVYQRFDPAWRTPTVGAIAAVCYADRAFDRLPVLADALEDAGCDAADLLAHLRGPGPHARGCWALDLVLGKG